MSFKSRLRPFVRHYDFLFHAKDYRGEVEAALKKARVSDSKDSHLIEIGSGSGRHSRYLSHHAKSLLAVDNDKDMMRLAQHQNSDLANVHWHYGEILDAPFLAPAQAVFALFYVLNYITGPDQLSATVRAVKDRLSTDGMFVFDCWNGDLTLQQGGRLDHRQTIGAEATANWRIATEVNRQMRMANIVYDITVHGASGPIESFTESIEIRLWSHEELMDLAREHSLTLMQRTAGLCDLSDATSESPRLCYAFRKE